MDENDACNSDENFSNLIPFDEWLGSIGKGRVTGWNWRKLGVVKAVNVFGRIYITRAEIARFEKRAESGEFASKEVRKIARKDAAPSHNKPARRFSLREFFKQRVANGSTRLPQAAKAEQKSLCGQDQNRRQI